MSGSSAALRMSKQLIWIRSDSNGKQDEACQTIFADFAAGERVGGAVCIFQDHLSDIGKSGATKRGDDLRKMV